MGQKLKYSKILCLCTIIVTLVTSGYGYTGDLPNLGEDTKQTIPDKNTTVQKANTEHFKLTYPVFPRIYSSYNVKKYSNYLEDLNNFSYLLAEIKDSLQSDKPNKLQLFCAKVHILNLHMVSFKSKYNSEPESHYTSYKELVNLDMYLSEISGYLRQTNKYRETSRGSLKAKIEDEKIIRQRVDMALVPLNNVIDIISDTH